MEGINKIRRIMEYLRKFLNRAEYEASAINRPGVSLISDTMDVIYDPIIPPVPEGFVDLGLPSGTLWAKYNLGATHGDTPESWYGHFYMWGDPVPVDDINCDWENYKWGTKDNLTKYNSTDGKTILEPADDPVTVALGLGYHMPTYEQGLELYNNTTAEWVNSYNSIVGLNGMMFYKVIVIPAIKTTTLFMPFDEQAQPSQELHEVTTSMWEYLSQFTLEELNDLVNRKTSGQITDIREVVYKDQQGSNLALYETDYKFLEKVADTSVNLFIPAAGWRSNATIYNQGSSGRFLLTSCNDYLASVLDVSDYDISFSGYYRCEGHSARAVIG